MEKDESLLVSKNKYIVVLKSQIKELEKQMEHKKGNRK